MVFSSVVLSCFAVPLSLSASMSAFPASKVRTRGSIKRRPPSRRFRRSLSEYGDGEDLGVNISSPENGAKEDGDEVFGPKAKTEEAETGSKEQKKQTGSDEKSPSRRGSSRSDEEKGEKQAEEMIPCKSNAGDTKEEEVCCSAPGEENSPQPPSGNKEKVCEGLQGEEQQGSACEQEKGDKEKEEAEAEAEAEAKESSESTDTCRTSDTKEASLAPEPLQDAVGLETASEPSTSATQDQGTA